MNLVQVLTGVIFVLFGRRFFWLFVGLVGFLLGMELAGLVLASQPGWVILVVALGAGLLGALLAVVAERVAFALAGFYAGIYLALHLASALGFGGRNLLLLVAGGIIGAVLAVLIMDWAIIALSCLVGAGALVTGVGLGPTVSPIVFLVLVILGVVFQTRQMERGEKGSA